MNLYKTETSPDAGPDLAADLALVTAAAERAGALALGFWRNDPRHWMKGGNSPVTEADVAVDELLRGLLGEARPDYGWLSEETADDPARLSRRRVFVVDPIDGTRGFLAGDRRWCVSVAVVEEGRPVVGALAAPALGRSFAALRGQGATLDGRALAVRDPGQLQGARLAGPKGWLGRGTFAEFGVAQVAYVPSLAYRRRSRR